MPILTPDRSRFTESFFGISTQLAIFLWISISAPLSKSVLLTFAYQVVSLIGVLVLLIVFMKGALAWAEKRFREVPMYFSVMLLIISGLAAVYIKVMLDEFLEERFTENEYQSDYRTKDIT